MNEGLPDIDPAIFEEDMSVELGMSITTHVDIFIKAKETIEGYESGRSGISPNTKLGDVLEGSLASFNRETGADVDISFGNVTVTQIGEESSEPVTMSLTEIAKDQYEQALSDRDESSEMLVRYIRGIQSYVANNLDGLYEPLLISGKSWELAWKKVRDIIRSMSGGNLADIVDFFDGLVEIQYPKTYNRAERLRGEEARRDVAAREFYIVMEPHIGTDIHRTWQ